MYTPISHDTLHRHVALVVVAVVVIAVVVVALLVATALLVAASVVGDAFLVAFFAVSIVVCVTIVGKRPQPQVLVLYHSPLAGHQHEIVTTASNSGRDVHCIYNAVRSQHCIRGNIRLFHPIHNKFLHMGKYQCTEPYQSSFIGYCPSRQETPRRSDSPPWRKLRDGIQPDYR